MPAPKDLNPYDNPFGYAVRRHRLRLGLTQEQLGKHVGYTGDAIGKFEKGDVAPSIELAKALDEEFGTHGDMEQLAELTRNGAFPSWMWEWIEAERGATMIRSWELAVVPGLLQTEAYARAILRAGKPGATEEQVEELVCARLERKGIFDRHDPPVLWFVIDEGVLHHEIGDPKTMHDQLQALIDASERPNLTAQVVPSSTGAYPGLDGAFWIASFDSNPDVVYLESARAGRVVHSPEIVQEIVKIWEAIRVKALPDRASLDLIAKVKEQWT